MNMLIFNFQKMTNIDALPSFLIDSNVSLRWKQWKDKELGHVPWLVAL
jgi:hypothetical protein